MQMRGTVSGL